MSWILRGPRRSETQSWPFVGCQSWPPGNFSISAVGNPYCFAKSITAWLSRNGPTVYSDAGRTRW